MNTLLQLIFAAALGALAPRASGGAAPAPAADAAASGGGSFDDLVAALPFVCQSFARSAESLPQLSTGWPPQSRTTYHDAPVEVVRRIARMI